MEKERLKGNSGHSDCQALFSALSHPAEMYQRSFNSKCYQDFAQLEVY